MGLWAGPMGQVMGRAMGRANGPGPWAGPMGRAHRPGPRADGRTGGRANGRTDRRAGGRTDGWAGGRTDGRAGGRTDGRAEAEAAASAADLSYPMLGCLDDWMHRCTLAFIDLRRSNGIFDDFNGCMWIEVSGSLLLEPLGMPGSLLLKPLGSIGLAVDTFLVILEVLGSTWLPCEVS